MPAKGGGKGKSGGKGYGKVGAKRHAKKAIRETILGVTKPAIKIIGSSILGSGSH